MYYAPLPDNLIAQQRTSVYNIHDIVQYVKLRLPSNVINEITQCICSAIVSHVWPETLGFMNSLNEPTAREKCTKYVY